MDFSGLLVVQMRKSAGRRESVRPNINLVEMDFRRSTAVYTRNLIGRTA